jgi:hypothetical protein
MPGPPWGAFAYVNPGLIRRRAGGQIQLPLTSKWDRPAAVLVKAASIVFAISSPELPIS